ncbi:MAG: Hsp20/alpha crystallin family protein [Turicibacter sp.]
MFNLSTFTNDIEKSNQEFNLFDLLGQMENMFVTTAQSALTNLNAFNIYDEGHRYVVTAHVPQYQKEDIKLLVEENRLIINLQQHSKQSSDAFSSQQFQSMTQSINVGDVEIEKIKASFNDGNLEIILPKKEVTVINRRIIELK